ncbi:MAG: LytTR family DNA-binding domain-containing protein [Melioribacteraceae bacterium]|nr:LytTR family DNA-binding domain-containing protein [Melioribacteraceae bacterium]MCF8356854.1 LytTR family DNA-binding domain-containing protein [Melioribacteraceae bacterium]MCF8396233.1 LytTR family DNA-binding domain-containing protein [Melioribacteraceae bacterium]MCF8421161.1 LytTR family DNA-binding domain-containing protein [Melioribacteraceae bacterium]
MIKNKIRCLVVDDEPLAANVIKSYIEKVDMLELVAICSNAVETFNKLNSSKIDLIFLDIKMPQISGMELMKSLTNPPQIILTTAFRDFAVESYEHGVIDYLLKPISFERFLKAIGKITLNQQSASILTAPEVSKQEFIFVKSNKKQVKVALDKILYIEGLKEYLQIITTTEKIISYLSLTYMIEKLPSDKFIRVHRSYIISINKIKSYSAAEITMPGKTIPIGNHYKQTTLKMLENFANTNN